MREIAARSSQEWSVICGTAVVAELAKMPVGLAGAVVSLLRRMPLLQIEPGQGACTDCSTSRDGPRVIGHSGAAGFAVMTAASGRAPRIVPHQPALTRLASGLGFAALSPRRALLNADHHRQSDCCRCPSRDQHSNYYGTVLRRLGVVLADAVCHSPQVADLRAVFIFRSPDRPPSTFTIAASYVPTHSNLRHDPARWFAR